MNGFYIRRENVFLDKVIRHSGWSTDKVVRLFRKDKGRYPNRRVHADLEIEGPVPVLENPFLHYTFRSFDQYFKKFLNYAEWGAAQAFRDGRHAGFVEIAFRPGWRFFRMYVLQLGFLDGLHGLVLCALQAFGVFLKYAFLWEYRIRERRGETVHLPAFDENARDLAEAGLKRAGTAFRWHLLRASRHRAAAGRARCSGVVAVRAQPPVAWRAESARRSMRWRSRPAGAASRSARASRSSFAIETA